MPASVSEPPSPPPTSLLSHTSALLDDVADEVREALHLYDAGGGNGGSGTSLSPTSHDASSEPCADAGLADEGVVGDLMGVYNELAAHRKGVTQLMAKVKRCALRAERAMQAATKAAIMSEGAPDATSKPKDKRGRKKGGATGLTKPFPVTDSLCAFVGVPPGTLLARAKVTKCLHKYIKDQGLKDSTNGQYVVPDATLKALLQWGEDDEDRVHIFAMQKRMNAHFLYGGSLSGKTRGESAETEGSPASVQQVWV